jgi:hypothetical protein
MMMPPGQVDQSLELLLLLLLLSDDEVVNEQTSIKTTSLSPFGETAFPKNHPILLEIIPSRVPRVPSTIATWAVSDGSS